MLHREHDGEATAFAAESKLDVKHFSHLASIKIMCVSACVCTRVCVFVRLYVCVQNVDTVSDFKYRTKCVFQIMF